MSPTTDESTEGPQRRAGSLVVFSDDWGRHPSSCQHLVSRLLDDHQVLWVNTIGTRSPSIDVATLRRGAEKARGWFFGRAARGDQESVGDVEAVGLAAPSVISPLMWPRFCHPAERALNRRLLTRSVNKSLSSLEGPRVAITTLPITADLVGELDVDAWLYYGVDDLAAWPGLDAEPLQQMERELVPKVDGVVSVSEHLRERLRKLGRDSTLITHGVDTDHWRGGDSAPSSLDQHLADAPEPRLVFWGLIDERLEADWVLALADRLEQGSVILTGPVESLDNAVRSHPRVRTPGPAPYSDLPALAWTAAALIMPYRDIEATRAMQPLKMKEYLATGRPCIVRALPATEPWSDCLDLASTQAEFVSLALERLQTGTPRDQRETRDRRLAAESWESKATAFEQAIRATLGCRASRTQEP